MNRERNMSSSPRSFSRQATPGIASTSARSNIGGVRVLTSHVSTPTSEPQSAAGRCPHNPAMVRQAFVHTVNSIVAGEIPASVGTKSLCKLFAVAKLGSLLHHMLNHVQTLVTSGLHGHIAVAQQWAKIIADLFDMYDNEFIAASFGDAKANIYLRHAESKLSKIQFATNEQGKIVGQNYVNSFLLEVAHGLYVWSDKNVQQCNTGLEASLTKLEEDASKNKTVLDVLDSSISRMRGMLPELADEQNNETLKFVMSTAEQVLHGAKSINASVCDTLKSGSALQRALLAESSAKAEFQMRSTVLAQANPVLQIALSDITTQRLYAAANVTVNAKRPRTAEYDLFFDDS